MTMTTENVWNFCPKGVGQSQVLSRNNRNGPNFNNAMKTKDKKGIRPEFVPVGQTGTVPGQMDSKPLKINNIPLSHALERVIHSLSRGCGGWDKRFLGLSHG